MILNAGGNNFFENFGNEVEVLNWTKVVEIVSGYRDGVFLRRGWTRACAHAGASFEGGWGGRPPTEQEKNKKNEENKKKDKKRRKKERITSNYYI